MTDKKQRDHLPDLVAEYSPKIKYHMKEYGRKGLPPHIDHDNLYEAGLKGLYQALESYKSSGKSNMSSWASMKIKHAMTAHITHGHGDPNAVPFKMIQEAKKFEEDFKNKQLAESAEPTVPSTPDIPED